MWINLAYLKATEEERLVGSTAIVKATCVDSIIIPFKAIPNSRTKKVFQNLEKR